MKKDNSTRIFIVEDDPIYSKMLSYSASMNPDHEVHLFTTGKDCISKLHMKPDVVTLDYSLPDMNGVEVFRRIKSFDPEIAVIILSGQTDVSVAVQLLKEGAYDYITKDNETRERLINTIHHISKNQNLEKQVNTLKEELEKTYDFNKVIVGNSNSIKKIFALIDKATKTEITVSITGETGTGKEVVAKAIHYNSSRKKGNFVAVNVSAIPKDLIESELFGYEKGAFTGANTRKIGKFEQADKGTLFLDEIGEMPPDMQAKLLRVLQERELTRVGGNDIVTINTRVIVATHRDLLEEVQNGNFREDLYYRLLGLPIALPPLRDRGDDILILAKHFADDFCKQNKLDKITISQEAKQKLNRYHYPGNIRELKAIMELSVVMCNDQIINPDDINFGRSVKMADLLSEEITLKEYEQKIIKYYLDKYDNNVLDVAKKLDIGKSTIYRMLKEN